MAVAINTSLPVLTSFAPSELKCRSKHVLWGVERAERPARIVNDKGRYHTIKAAGEGDSSPSYGVSFPHYLAASLPRRLAYLWPLHPA
jgi:hypothetical protein